MDTVCEYSQCSGCMACINSCSQNAISFEDTLFECNCIIDDSKCLHCEKCKKVCPNNKPLAKYKPFLVKQGWANERIRTISSSGGFASAIMEAFIDNDGFVCSCIFDNGHFIFKTTNDKSMIKRFAGSKYVKSNPMNTYNSIMPLIKQNKKVLFVGLPCQSAGIIRYFCDNKNIYTLDLICHGTPSEKIFYKFLKDSKVDVSSLDNILFRKDSSYGLIINNIKMVPNRIQDSYTKMFLDNVDFTENCYSCNYATLDRVSDITLGDAWGQLSDTTPHGVSLLLCQTEKGKELVELAQITLKDVDIEKIILANHQLSRPSIKHKRRSIFIKLIRKNRSFRFASFCVDPKNSMKQSIKFTLIRLGLLADK